MRTFRFVQGYIVGMAVFVVLIPIGIYFLSTLEPFPFSATILANDLIRWILLVPLFIVGVFFSVWSNLDLMLKGEGGPTDFDVVVISPRTRKLVVDGPYRYTRNPMVFGVNAVYASLALFFNSWGALLAWLLFFAAIVRFFVSREEKRLLADFGEEYEKYRATTPKMVPFLKRSGSG